MPPLPASKPLRRFHRADPARGEALPPFDFQLRDREILKVIYELRLATAETLQHLITPLALSDRHEAALAKARAGYSAWLQSEQEAGRRNIHGRPSGTKRGILDRLKKLYHHGYLGRRKLSNNQPILYHLGPRAVAELVSQYGIDHERALLQTQTTGEYFLEHTLMIGRFRAALTQALQAHQAELALWEPDGAFRESVRSTSETGEQEEIPVIPDGYFALHHNSNLHHFFLEIDRGTMRPARFYQKLRGYLELFNQGIHKHHQIDHFRVLTITPTDARKEILRATAKILPSKRGLFWFASEPRFSDNPNNVLASIWRTAKNDAWRELCEARKAPRWQASEK